jgi:hypothetical protein
VARAAPAAATAAVLVAAREVPAGRRALGKRAGERVVQRGPEALLAPRERPEQERVGRRRGEVEPPERQVPADT